MPRKSPKQKVFRYLMGLHFGICHGPVDRVLRFLAGDRQAWAGSVEANSTVAVDAPDLFGGNASEGGIAGNLTVMMGGPAQTLPANVAAALPAQAPAFRGVLSLFYDGLISANNPYIKPMAFQVERIRAGWAGGGCWYAEKAGIPNSYSAPSPSPTGSPQEYAVSFAETFELGLAPYTITGATDHAIVVTGGVGITLGVMDYATPVSVSLVREMSTSYVDAIKIEFSFSVTNPDAEDYPNTISSPSIAFRYGDVALFSFTPQSQRSFHPVTAEPMPRVPSFTFRWPGGGGPGHYESFSEGLGLSEATSGRVRATFSSTTLSVSLVSQKVDANGEVVEVLSPTKSISGSFTDHVSLNKLAFGISQQELGAGQPTVKFHSISVFDAWEGGPDPGPTDYEAMNPAHIIYQCLTDPHWGMGYPIAAIDDASFTAAADTLYAEGLGLCLLWNTSDEIGAFVGKVLDHAGGVLYTDPQTGKFKLTLLRADYDPGALPVYDESNIVALESFQRVGYGDTVNEIVVVYRDVATNKDASVTVQNLANIQAQGAVVSQTRQYPGLPTEALAMRVAQRDLDAGSIPLAKARIKLNRKGWDRTPGSCIKLGWPKLGLAGVVMRVLDIDGGTLEDGAITITCAEDVFGLPASTYAEQEPPGWVPPSTGPQPIARQAMMEAPYYMLAHTLPDADLAALDVDASFFAALAMRPTSLSIGFTIESRVGAAAYESTGSGLFVPGGELAGDLEPAAVSTIVLANPADLDRVQAGMLAVVGGGRAAEIVRVLTIDINTSTMTVDRGVIDTTPRRFTAGAKVFCISGDESSNDTTERATAETIDYRLLPQATGAQLDPGLATPMTATADQRQVRPLAPGNLKINGVMFPATVPDAIAVTWAHRNRLQQTEGMVLQTDGDVTPEPDTLYVGYVYDDESGALRKQSTALAEPAWSVAGLGAGQFRLEIATVRDGIESWQRNVRRFYCGELLLTEAGELLLTEAGETIAAEDVAPEGIPTLTLQKKLSQAVECPMIAAGVLYGLWRYDNTSCFDQHVLGRAIATDTGTFMSATLSDTSLWELLSIGGGILYAACADTTACMYLTNAYIHRIDVGGSAVTWTAPAGELIRSLGWDGTYLWSYGTQSGALRKHNASTLAVLDTFDLPDKGGISWGGQGAWSDGKMLVITGYSTVACCDPAEPTPVVWTADLGQQVNGVFARGLLFFVQVTGGVKVIDSSDGTVLVSYADGAYGGVRDMVGAATTFAYQPSAGIVRWLSATDGSVVRERSLAGTQGYFQAALDDVVITAKTDDMTSNWTWIYDI